MAAKDFYKILDIPNTASQDEIKKAYRQLALKYHPDVNPGGKATENWFREINEAYKVLNDPDKRSAYNQDRWYRESTVSGKAEPPKTPEQMLIIATRLARHTAAIDKDRTNYIALQQYLMHLLREENLEMLQQWNDQSANRQIVMELTGATHALSYNRFIPIAEKLEKLGSTNSDILQPALETKKRASYWRNYQFPVILLVAILLCLLIYLAGR